MHSFLCGVIKMVLIVIANRLLRWLPHWKQKHNVTSLFSLSFMNVRWQQLSNMPFLLTKISEHRVTNNSILLWISLEKTQNIIAALFLILHVKTPQQTFNRILLWTVWSGECIIVLRRIVPFHPLLTEGWISWFHIYRWCAKCLGRVLYPSK